MVGSTTQARKAWNEAMRTAAGGNLPQLTSAVPLRSDRRKRRDRARKPSSSTNAQSGGTNDDDFGDSADAEEYRNAVRLDALEGVVDCDIGGFDEQALLEDDEEYDELEDYIGEGGGGAAGRKRRKALSKKKETGGGNNVVPKRFRHRSLASILIEESSRGNQDGVLKKILDAEARPKKISCSSGTSSRSGGRHRYPKRRKFCPVTGLEGVYTDPKSGIPYANLKALEQIRERQPPWILQGSGGTASYFEAVKSLRNED